MTLEQFLNTTKERLPTADEFVGLCDAVGIKFAYREDGTPVLRADDKSKDVAELVAKLIKREPWRSQVIERKLKQSKPVAEVELLWANGYIGRKLASEKFDIGAGWWRAVGSDKWNKIEGRDYPFPQGK